MGSREFSIPKEATEKLGGKVQREQKEAQAIKEASKQNPRKQRKQEQHKKQREAPAQKKA